MVFIEVKLRYLIDHEWASCADVLLWMRTRPGMILIRHESDTLKA